MFINHNNQLAEQVAVVTLNMVLWFVGLSYTAHYMVTESELNGGGASEPMTPHRILSLLVVSITISVYMFISVHSCLCVSLYACLCMYEPYTHGH